MRKLREMATCLNSSNQCVMELGFGLRWSHSSSAPSRHPYFTLPSEEAGCWVVMIQLLGAPPLAPPVRRKDTNLTPPKDGEPNADCTREKICAGKDGRHLMTPGVM